MIQLTGLKWQTSYSQGRVGILRQSYGKGGSETKGMEDDRNKLEKRKYHIEKGHENRKYGITYTCNVYGGGGGGGWGDGEGCMGKYGKEWN
jgi:hypothetical protein